MLTTVNRVLGAGVLALGALLATLSPAASPAALAAETGWRVVYSSPDFPADGFSDVAVTGTNTAWAVGTSACCDEADQMQIRRWDGAQWQAVSPPQPPPGTRYPALVRVGASSDTDVWVFGLGTDTSRFASHWDGTTWQTTDFGPDIQINDALVPAPGTAWLVGTSWNGTDDVPIARRFDGSGWADVPIPGTAERLSGVAANDVWAIGRTADFRPVTMRWNGASWRTVALPRLSLEPGVFASPGDILALGRDNVWATEVLGKDEGVWPGSVLLHWNGKRWRQVRVAGAQDDSLYRLAPDGQGGLWILSANVFPHPYLLHYSQGRVTRQLVPAQQGATPTIEEIAPIPGTASLWAVGGLTRDDTGQSAATVFRYDP